MWDDECSLNLPWSSVPNMCKSDHYVVPLDVHGAVGQLRLNETGRENDRKKLWFISERRPTKLDDWKCEMMKRKLLGWYFLYFMAQLGSSDTFPSVRWMLICKEVWLEPVEHGFSPAGSRPQQAVCIPGLSSSVSVGIQSAPGYSLLAGFCHHCCELERHRRGSASHSRVVAEPDTSFSKSHKHLSMCVCSTPSGATVGLSEPVYLIQTYWTRRTRG